MNRRGQALVEFVLILPVFLLLLLSVYDFGMIFNKKNTLTGITDDIVSMYNDGKTIDEIKNMYSEVDINVVSGTEYDKIVVSSNVKIVTPGLNRILGNPYVIKVERYLVSDNE